MRYKNIRKVITLFYPVIFPILKILANFFRKCTNFLYGRLMNLDWTKLPGTEWMDHDQDTLYQYYTNGSFLHFERGIIPRLITSKLLFNEEEFTKLKIKKKINILDLCSGDSYISQRFFFDCAKNIVSVDLDPQALKRGKDRLKQHKFMEKNHHFIQGDIEKDQISDLLKKNNLDFKFDIILFNMAIEHFNENELEFLLKSLIDSMNEKSFIFSATIIEDENDAHYLPEHHEMFFANKDQLENIFKKYFKYTISQESLVNNRWNIYCAASNYKIDL
jgi:cyclopropane fatty-acyl-phospholipid synthase-like methyltransferase